MSSAVLGYGTLLKRGDGGGPEVFTAIAEVKDISEFGAERELVEVTHYTSPSGYREFILGLKDGSQFTARMNWIPSHATQSSTAGVVYDFNNDTVHNYQLVFPTSPAVTAAVALRAMSFRVLPPNDGALELEVNFKVSGAITWS